MKCYSSGEVRIEFAKVRSNRKLRKMKWWVGLLVSMLACNQPSERPSTVEQDIGATHEEDDDNHVGAAHDAARHSQKRGGDPDWRGFHTMVRAGNYDFTRRLGINAALIRSWRKH